MEIEISREIFQQKGINLFVGTPMYGGNAHGMYIKSCLDLQSVCFQYGIPVRFQYLFNESLITRARNYLVDEFLRSDCTHLLFIDSDIDFNAIDILALLAIDKDLIGAPYPKKSISWKNVKNAVLKNPDIEPGLLENVVGEYVFNVVPGTKQFKVTEPIEVLELGTGYMLIKREVFTKFKEAYPHLEYKPDHVGSAHFGGDRYIHAYFDTIIDPETDRYLSEDYMFVRHWRDIGGKVWMCPWMQTKHVGTYAFTGNLPFIANTIREI